MGEAFTTVAAWMAWVMSEMSLDTAWFNVGVSILGIGFV